MSEGRGDISQDVVEHALDQGHRQAPAEGKPRTPRRKPKEPPRAD